MDIFSVLVEKEIGKVLAVLAIIGILILTSKLYNMFKDE
jgi:hypothetical protein